MDRTRSRRSPSVAADSRDGRWWRRGIGLAAAWAVIVVGVTAPVAAADETAVPHQQAAAQNPIVVNGHQLTATEVDNLSFLATTTLPALQGSAAERLQAVSTVAWWSLKEGVLSLDNAHSFNNCLIDGVDTHVGPADGCADSVWQVGIAGIQVHDQSVAMLENTATQLYPGQSADDVVRHTLDYAGFPAGSAVADAVSADRGQIRASWLARNHRVAVTLQAPRVEQQCFQDLASWCFGAGWDRSSWYASDVQVGRQVRSELAAILTDLAGAPAPDPDPDPGTFTARVLDLGGVSLNVRSAATPASQVVATLDTGASIEIACQTEGPEVVNDIDGYVSTLWDYLPQHGGFVSDAWVYTGVNGRVDGVPDCS